MINDSFNRDVLDYNFKSDVYEIKKKNNYRKWTGIFFDAQIFIIDDDNGLHESLLYNKNYLFQK